MCILVKNWSSYSFINTSYKIVHHNTKNILQVYGREASTLKLTTKDT